MKYRWGTAQGRRDVWNSEQSLLFPEGSSARRQLHLNPQWSAHLYPEVRPAQRGIPSSEITHSGISADPEDIMWEPQR